MITIKRKNDSKQFGGFRYQHQEFTTLPLVFPPGTKFRINDEKTSVCISYKGKDTFLYETDYIFISGFGDDFEFIPMNETYLNENFVIIPDPIEFKVNEIVEFESTDFEMIVPEPMCQIMKYKVKEGYITSIKEHENNNTLTYKISCEGKIVDAWHWRLKKIDKGFVTDNNYCSSI